MSIYLPFGAGTYNLNSSISSTDTTITLTSFLEPVSDVPYTMALLNTDIVYGTIAPRTTSSEFISFTGITQNADGTATLTGVTRGLAKKYPFTTNATFKLPHAGQSVFIISDAPQVFNKYMVNENAETITGLKTFPAGGNAAAPVSGTSYTAPTNNLEYTSKQYVDNVAVAGAPDANTTTKGVVQEATQAQIEAGTATGSTGANLYINPSKSGARIYYGYAVDAGASDTYVVTCTPVPTAYTAGMVIQFNANTANTGACTINVNALGAKSLKVNKDLDPQDGYIKADQIVTIIYDGTNFQILSVAGKPSVSQSGEEIYGASSGGSDTYAVTLAPVPASYTTGMTVRFKADVANTGAATLNVNGLGAKTIKKNVTTDLETNDLLANQVNEVIYDGTNFQLISPTSQQLYAAGVMTPLSTTAIGNNDTTIACGFQPRFIKLHYFLQGHTSSGANNVYVARNGTAVYSSTTLVFDHVNWDNPGTTLGGMAADNSSRLYAQSDAVASFITDPTSTTAPVAGTGGGNAAEISATMSINAVSSTGFTIRIVTAGSGGGNTARAKIAYEAWA